MAHNYKYMKSNLTSTTKNMVCLSYFIIAGSKYLNSQVKERKGFFLAPRFSRFQPILGWIQARQHGRGERDHGMPGRKSQVITGRIICPPAQSHSELPLPTRICLPTPHSSHKPISGPTQKHPRRVRCHTCMIQSPPQNATHGQARLWENTQIQTIAKCELGQLLLPFWYFISY